MELSDVLFYAWCILIVVTAIPVVSFVNDVVSGALLDLHRTRLSELIWWIAYLLVVIAGGALALVALLYRLEPPGELVFMAVGLGLTAGAMIIGGLRLLLAVRFWGFDGKYHARRDDTELIDLMYIW